jgi:hypothetical protein
MSTFLYEAAHIKNDQINLLLHPILKARQVLTTGFIYFGISKKTTSKKFKNP